MATLMEYMDHCLILRVFECSSLFVHALRLCEEMALKQKKVFVAGVLLKRVMNSQLMCVCV